MKIKNLIRVVAASLVRWLRFGCRPNAPAPPPEQLDLGLDPITEIGLRLHKALPVRSAEYWPPAGVHAPFSTAAKKFPRTKAPGSASNTKHLKEAFVAPQESVRLFWSKPMPRTMLGRAVTLVGSKSRGICLTVSNQKPFVCGLLLSCKGIPSSDVRGRPNASQ